jgi:hypothetical protein
MEMESSQAETPKLYQVDSNGVLREAPLTSDTPRYPSFHFSGTRERGDRLNPYLVILAAEIKFRRYRASPNAPRLDAEYEALITKTINVASLLYWEPLTGANARRLFPPEPGEKMDVDEDGTDESEVTRELLMNFRGENNDAGGSTGGKEKVGAERPDVDWRSLLSGHGEQILLFIKFHCFHVFIERSSSRSR